MRIKSFIQSCASRIVAPPALFVPTLYFAEGLPYTMVNMMSVIFFKTLGLDNAIIGLCTSAFYIPWTIKFLWAPFIDLFSTRRTWILVSQIVLAVVACILAFTSLSKQAINVYISLFVIIAFVSATQDIAIDGYYIGVLDTSKQALFVGVRNAAYKVAWLFGSGALVFLAGYWSQNHGNNNESLAVGWSISFLVCACVFLATTVLHLFILPRESKHAQNADYGKPHRLGSFFRVMSSFIEQPRIAAIILYILIFRMGDALLLKMAQPFLVDPANRGGLGISVSDIGIIYGTIGIFFLLAGGLVGGWLVSKYGLKNCLLPTAIIQNTAILLYWALAIFKPQTSMVCIVNALEQFSYGLGTAAYTVFLLSVVKDEYKAAHYAIATALMALGLMLPGAISGYLADYLGYQKFFFFAFLCSLPGIVCIFFLPLKQKAT